jgi:hypothetical protein
MYQIDASFRFQKLIAFTFKVRTHSCVLSRRLGRFWSHFGHYEGKKYSSATARNRNLWVIGKTIHFIWSKTFSFYRCEINSQVMAFKIHDFFDGCQSIARSYIPRTITRVEVYSYNGIPISGVFVICRCVCVCV